MKTNELIECFREIVQNFDESQQDHINKEIIYWRTIFINSIKDQIYSDKFDRVKNVFLSIDPEMFNERSAEEWINFIKTGINHENK